MRAGCAWVLAFFAASGSAAAVSPSVVGDCRTPLGVGVTSRTRDDLPAVLHPDLPSLRDAPAFGALLGPGGAAAAPGHAP